MATKLILEGYGDPYFGGMRASFTASINPEQITIKKGIAYNTEDNFTNTAGNTPKFKGMEDDDVSFDLHFDGTGIANDGKVVDVAQKIKSLYDTVYYYKGDIHKPYYTKIRYGSFQYQGTLKSISTTYTLFDGSGDPLRAKVSLSFMQFIDPRELSAKANNQSPDMTHIKTVRIGDHLPLMCKEIYGSVKYYQEIARINNLTNFRNLDLGAQLVFPPIEK